MKRLMAAAVALVLASLGTIAARADTIGACEPASDAGNVAASALELSGPRVACRGDLSAQADGADWYSMRLTAGQVATVVVSPEPPLVANALQMTKPDDSTRVPAASFPGQPPVPGVSPPGQTRTYGCADNVNARDLCVVRADVSGLWKIGVIREVGAGPYDLAIDVTAPQNDCGLERDAPDTFAPLSFVELPLVALDDPAGTRRMQCTARFDADDTADVFGFQVFETMRIYADFTGAAGVAGPATILDPLGTVVADERISSDPSVDVIHQAKMSGVYGFRVPKSQRADSFTITITVEQRDCGNQIGTDAPNAGPGLDVAGQCPGVLDARAAGGELGSAPIDVVDRYAFPSEAPASVTTILTAPVGACFRMTLTDPAGSSRTPVQSCNGNAVSSTGGTHTGTWSVVIERVGETVGGKYLLAVEGIVGPQKDCGEAGDASSDQAQARLVEFGTSQTPWTASCDGHLRPATDRDHIKFQAVRGSIIDLSLGDPKPANVRACLLVGTSNACRTTPTKVAASEAGEWVVRIDTTGTQTEKYSLSISQDPTSDCSLPYDAGDDKASATPITQPLSCAATASQLSSVPAAAAASEFAHATLDVEDWYRFDASDVSGFVVRAEPTTTTSTLDLEICVHAPSSTTPRCMNGSGPGLQESIVHHACDVPPGIRIPLQPCSGAGTWYVQIKQSGTPIAAAYRLLIAGKD